MTNSFQDRSFLTVRSLLASAVRVTVFAACASGACGVTGSALAGGTMGAVGARGGGFEVSDLRFEKSPLIAPDSSRARQLAEFDALSLALTAFAEDRPTPFGVGAGFEHQFRTDIDRGGSMSVNRFNAGVRARFRITPEMGISLGFRYDLYDYNFSGTTMLAPAPGVADPWDDIHTLTFTTTFTLALDADWSVFGGPVFQISRESGASVRDSWVGGGVFGGQYIVSPEMTVGLGVGVVSQIEDSMRIFPVILVHWELMEGLWLSTRSIAETTGDAGVELVYAWGGGIETAIGVAYRYRRFRLDSGGGVAPDGVGQNTYIPLWLRVGYRVTPNLTINAHGGMAMAGELRLENSGGARIGRQDYDPAGLVGVSVSFRF